MSHLFNRLSIIIFNLGLIILPSVHHPQILNGYEVPKIWFFQKWVEVLVILTLLKIIFCKPTFSFKKILIPTLLILLYFTWNLITTLTGLDPQTSFFGEFWRGQGLLQLSHYALLALIMPLILTGFSIRLLKISIITASFSTSVFLLTSLVAKSLLDWPLVTYLGRPVGSFGNPNFLAGFLVISLPWVFFLKNLSLKLLIIFLLLASIFFTGSRGAWLSLIGTVAILFTIFLIKKRQIIPLIILLLTSSVFIAYNLYAFLPELRGTMTNRPCQFINGCENLTGSRERIYVRGVLAFLERPLTGYGLENYERAVRRIDYPFKIPQELEERTDKAHNEILEILLSSGLIGLGLWVLLITWTIRAFWPNKILLASLLIFLLKAQTNVTSTSEYVLFWILVGLAMKIKS